VAFGDTLTLAEYLDGSTTYDFRCRRHDDPLRYGESLFGAIRNTRHLAIVRTYLRYQIPTATKNRMLWAFSGRRTPDGISALKLLMANDAHLDHPEDTCHLLGMVDTLMKFDSLGYDLNWVSDRTGNNILMDYCSCSKDLGGDDLNEVIRYFVSIGVRTDIKNHEGEMATDIAKRSGLIEVLRVAEREGK